MTDDQPTSLKQLIRFIVKLCQGKFYGSITVNFRAGQITTITQEQTFKATDLPDD